MEPSPALDDLRAGRLCLWSGPGLSLLAGWPVQGGWRATSHSCLKNFTQGFAALSLPDLGWEPAGLGLLI